MSKDIRSFFTTVGGSKKKDNTSFSNLGITPQKKSKGAKKRVVVLSDSDDDIIPSSTLKRSKVQSVPDEITPKNVGTKQASVITASKPKLVNPMDIFGSTKVKRSAEVTSASTTKEEVVEVPKKKKKKKGTGDAVAGWDESFTDIDFLSTLDQLDAIEAQATKSVVDKPIEIIKTECTPIKISEENGKTSLTLKFKGKAPDKLEKNKKSNEKLETHTKVKRKSSKKADKQLDEIIAVEVSTKKDKLKKHEKDKKCNVPSNETKRKFSDVDETPVNETSVLEGEDDEPSWANDPAEKRRLSAMGYQRYLAREGPKNLGLKDIPKGKADCLKGLVFVVSGVLDSLEREAAAELIQECGGKVTSSVSRNTSYIVLGEDPGPSKVHKAKQLGTKQVDEDGLLDLIRSKSGIPSVAKAKSPPKETKTTSSYFDKNPEKPVSNKIIDEKKKDKVCNKQLSTGVDSKKFYGKTSDKDKKDTSSLLSMEQKTKKDCAAVKSSSNGADSKNSSRKPLSQDKSESSSSKVQTAARAASPQATESLMWVDKYRPTCTKQIIGQQGEGSNLKKLTKWLENWHRNQFSGKKLERPNPWARNDDGAFFKAALLSGPPGVGKTTTAHLVCKELGFDVVEFNASDTRSKKLLHDEVSELLSNKSLYQFFQGSGKGTSAKHVLLMDEVDGMAGNEDRGGISELIQLIKNSKVPIICMCNDHNHQKLRSFIGHCFDLRFSKPRVEQIRGAMMSVCFKEGVKMSPDILSDMIIGSSQDVRQILHHLSMYAAKETSALSKDLQKEQVKQIKNIKLGPWDVLKKVFSAEDHKTMSINDKSDLFFFDYNISPLFVQENYLQVAPDSAKNNVYKRLDLISAAADSICWGDVVEKTVRSKQAWALLPTQAMFSSVIPGELLEGNLTGQIAFPQWLGKNSRRGKFDRLLQELHIHTRLSTSGNKQSLNLDYLPAIRDGITRPLVKKGEEGIPEAINVMQSYHLMRADLDSIMEISVWPKEKNPMSCIDTKVKSAFTRTFNKESVMLPYSTTMALSKSKSTASSSTFEGENDEEEGAEEEQEYNNDIAGDSMIKATKKAAPKKEVASDVKKGRGSGPLAGGSKGNKGGKGKGKSK